VTGRRARALRVDAALPAHWHAVDLDDVDAWLERLHDQVAPGAPAGVRNELSGDVVGALGMMDLTHSGTGFVYVPPGDAPRVDALLLVARWPHRPVLRRGDGWYEGELRRALAAWRAENIAMSWRQVPLGRALRCQTVLTDELGDRVEAVLYLVVPEGDARPYVLRLQWRPGDPRAGGFAGLADDVARRATLNEVT
jgi:hypothetical protein